MPHKDPDTNRAYQKAWRAGRKAKGLCAECDCPAAPNRTRCLACMGRRDGYHAERRTKLRAEGKCIICSKPAFSAQVTCRGCITRETNRQQAFRQAALDRYGRACACCGETEERFLCFDHVNNDGAAHRKTYKGDLAIWLARNSFPAGFQTLCFNCNMGKNLSGGVCPHQAKAVRAA